MMKSVSSSLSNANTSLTSCRTVTPAWLYSVCLVRMMLSLFGNGRDPIPSNVFLPITILWFNVFSLKYFRSFGRCQGNAPPFPMIPLSSSAHNNAIILCFAAQPSQRPDRSGTFTEPDGGSLLFLDMKNLYSDRCFDARVALVALQDDILFFHFKNGFLRMLQHQFRQSKRFSGKLQLDLFDMIQI